MPSSINSKARRRQRRIASALRRDDSAATQVQVPLAPDARVLVDDAVLWDGGGRLGLGVGVVAVVAVAVVPVVAAGVAVVVVAVLVTGGGGGVAGGVAGIAELPGPVGAADV